MSYGILDGNGEVMIPFVAPMALISNSPSMSMDAVSLKRYTSSHRAQRWEIKTRLYPEDGTTRAMVHSMQHGHTAPFWVRPPQPWRVAITNTRPAKVNVVSGVKGDTVVRIDNTQGIIAAGTLVTFSNHEKVYVLISDFRPGDDSALVEPPLQHNVTGARMLHTAKDVKMKVRYDSTTVLGITYVDGILSDPGEVTLVEAL